MIERTPRDGARKLLVRGTLGTGLLRLLSAGLGFFASILLARRLGVGEYGQYAFALSWVSVLGILGLAGLDRLLIRLVAALRTQGRWDELAGLLRWSGGAGLAVSLTLAALAAGIGSMFAARHAAVLLSAPVAWLLAPLLVLMRLPQAALRGLNQVVRSQIPETLVQPVVLIVGIVAAGWFGGGHLTASQALGVYAAATMAAIAVAFGLLLRVLPGEMKEVAPTYQRRLWMAGALPLLLVSGLDIVNTQMNLLMLGSLAGARAVSLYAAADRGAGLVAFPLTAANASLAPLFAGLYATGERERLQRLVTKSARAILLCATVLALA
ncbi:MAG: oligosaccharide flippase family protein, partial [Armatimonadota bacterium]|nr:oligosaccharide flippase family protein [Armatimonadota bacterium]